MCACVHVHVEFISLFAVFNSDFLARDWLCLTNLLRDRPNVDPHATIAFGVRPWACLCVYVDLVSLLAVFITGFWAEWVI